MRIQVVVPQCPVLKRTDSIIHVDAAAPSRMQRRHIVHTSRQEGLLKPLKQAGILHKKTSCNNPLSDCIDI